MGQARKRGTKEERVKAAIEKDNTIALERAMQKHQQSITKKKDKELRSDDLYFFHNMYCIVGNTMFYNDDRTSVRW